MKISNVSEYKQFATKDRNQVFEEYPRNYQTQDVKLSNINLLRAEILEPVPKKAIQICNFLQTCQILNKTRISLLFWGRWQCDSRIKANAGRFLDFNQKQT